MVRALPAGLLFALMLCFMLGSCHSQNTSETSEQIDILFEQNRELERHLRTLAEEVARMKQQQEEERKKTAPIFRAELQPNGSHKDDPFYGLKNSNVIMMSFSDYRCAPCREFATKTLPSLKSEYFDSGKVQFIFRDFPLQTSSRSLEAAILAHCAGEQGKYWNMHDSLFAKADAVEQGAWEEIAGSVEGLETARALECLQSGKYRKEVQDDIQEALALGAQGAPGFFIAQANDQGSLTGFFVRGAQPKAVFTTQLEALLR